MHVVRLTHLWGMQSIASTLVLQCAAACLRDDATKATLGTVFTHKSTLACVPAWTESTEAGTQATVPVKNAARGHVLLWKCPQLWTVRVWLLFGQCVRRLWVLLSRHSCALVLGHDGAPRQGWTAWHVLLTSRTQLGDQPSLGAGEGTMERLCTR